MCGPGADSDNAQMMTWKANTMYTVLKFVDFAGGITWFNGTAMEVAGNIDIVKACRWRWASDEEN